MASELSKLYVVIAAKTDELEESLRKVNLSVNKLGVGMMAAGGVIAAALGVAYKAAEEERVGIAKLGAVLENVGVQYADVREELERVIAATQRKTGIADDQQRAALRALIVTTGDYRRALELLPLALDLAVAKDMDFVSAAELVGRVAQGNTAILSRYGFQLKENATAAEALATLQQKVAGTAEQAVSPIDILKTTLGDLQEAIGSALIPTISSLLNDYVIPVVSKFKEWADNNPTLIRAIAALAGVLVGAGGLLVALMTIVKVIKEVNAALVVMRALMGPAGWAQLAIGVAAAAAAIGAITVLTEKASEVAVPGLQHGGIITRPTLALLGEGGPEAVVPLSEYRGTVVNVHIGNFIGDDMTVRQLARTIGRVLDEDKRRHTYEPAKTEYYSAGGHL